MTIRLLCLGMPSNPDIAENIYCQYLKKADIEAHDGCGYCEFTANKDEAMKFEHIRNAFEFIQSVPRSRPIREDGKSNKPLTAFTWEMINDE